MATKINYTQDEVFRGLKAAGFSEANAEILAACSMVEGIVWVGGNPFTSTVKLGDLDLMDEVVNGKMPFGPSVGTMQIRTEKVPPTKYVDYNWLYGNFVNQMLAAKHKYDTQGLRAWSSYTNGSYKGWMQKAVFNPVPTVPVNMHLIEGGQYLSTIAALPKYQRRFTWQELALVNGLVSPYWIFTGKSLKLPVWEYKVVSGDNLTKIAAMVGHLTVNDLVQYNKLANPNLLSIGQVILIPDPAILEGR